MATKYVASEVLLTARAVQQSRARIESGGLVPLGYIELIALAALGELVVASSRTRFGARCGLKAVIDEFGKTSEISA